MSSLEGGNLGADTEGRQPRDNGGRDWSNVKKQDDKGSWEPQGARHKQEKNPVEPPEKSRTCSQSDFGLPASRTVTE